MFITYLLRELRRRMRQAIFVAAGLALGIGLVITVIAASSGVSASQGAVLHSLYGVGTDVTVTQAPRLGRAGRPEFGSAAARPGGRRHQLQPERPAGRRPRHAQVVVGDHDLGPEGRVRRRPARCP